MEDILLKVFYKVALAIEAAEVEEEEHQEGVEHHEVEGEGEVVLVEVPKEAQGPSSYICLGLFNVPVVRTNTSQS